MYEILSAMIGFLGALMMTMNGELGRHLGSLPGNLVVHLSGLILLAVVGRGWRRLPRGLNPLRLTGGALGFLSVLLVNLSFPSLGVALTLGLSLLGQALASVIVDSTGLLWAERRPIRPRLLVSLILIVLGIAAMSRDPAALEEGIDFRAAAWALAAGFTTVAGRRVNARLSTETNPQTSALWNYGVGTACGLFAVAVVFGLGLDLPGLLGPFGAGATSGATSIPVDLAVYRGGLPARIPVWAWFGGAVGLLFVTLSNRVTPRIGAYAMAICIFLGQIGGSLAVETLLRGRLDASKLVGGALILAGLILKGLLERGVSGTGPEVLLPRLK